MKRATKTFFGGAAAFGFATGICGLSVMDWRYWLLTAVATGWVVVHELSIEKGDPA